MNELALAPATVVVYDATGEPVWSMEDVTSSDIATLTCLTSFKGSTLAAGIRSAVEDAEAIAAGRDPGREREEAARSQREIEEEMEEDSLVTALLSRARADYRKPFTWAVKAQDGDGMEIAVYHGEVVRVYRAATDRAAPDGIRVQECEPV